MTVTDQLPPPKTYETGGRPTKLTPELQEQICNLVRQGNYLEPSFQHAGVHPKTYYHWLKKAEQAYENGETENIYLGFYYAIKKAEAEQEADLVPKIIDTSVKKDDPYAMMMFLERRHPDRWGRKDRNTVIIDEHKTVTITRVEVVKPEGYINGEVVEQLGEGEG